VLAFADHFEARFVGQGQTDRDMEETLDLAWELFGEVPPRLLKRIPQELLVQHRGGEP
jgi:V/A-type H+/Na+-transporting ATPase subunit B